MLKELEKLQCLPAGSLLKNLDPELSSGDTFNLAATEYLQPFSLASLAWVCHTGPLGISGTIIQTFHAFGRAWRS